MAIESAPEHDMSPDGTAQAEQFHLAIIDQGFWPPKNMARLTRTARTREGPEIVLVAMQEVGIASGDPIIQLPDLQTFWSPRIESQASIAERRVLTTYARYAELFWDDITRREGRDTDGLAALYQDTAHLNGQPLLRVFDSLHDVIYNGHFVDAENIVRLMMLEDMMRQQASME